MQNISIKDGYKSFTINNDPDKVIKFNPNDINILNRIQEVENGMNEIVKELEEYENADYQTQLEKIKEVDNKIREQFNYIFDYPVCDVIFGNTNLLSTVKGVPFCMRVLEAITPIIKREIKLEQKETEKRIAKHTGKYVSTAPKHKN